MSIRYAHPNTTLLGVCKKLQSSYFMSAHIGLNMLKRKNYAFSICTYSTEPNILLGNPVTYPHISI